MLVHVGDISARLERCVRKTRGDGKLLYEVISSPNSVVIRETTKEGEARLEYRLPVGTRCITWNLQSSGCFLFLQGDESADGTLLVCSADGRFEAHIIECKKKIAAGSWSKAKSQMRASLTKLLAITGVIGIQLDAVYFGTAFRDDSLDPANSTNARWGTPLLEADSNDPAVKEQKERAEDLLDWNTGRIRLRGFEQPFPHAKLKLDEMTGHGTYMPNNEIIRT